MLCILTVLVILVSALLDPRAKNKADAAMLGVLDLAAGVAAHQPNICLVDCSALDFVTRFFVNKMPDSLHTVVYPFYVFKVFKFSGFQVFKTFLVPSFCLTFSFFL